MASIELENVTKEFAGGVVAVDDVSLTIADGEFMVLVGPSGCGKSTLLRMIAGLEEVTEGSISIGGRDVTGLAPRHRDIAMVFQNYALYPHMDVRKNLGYGLRVRKTPGPEIGQRVAVLRDGVIQQVDTPQTLYARPDNLFVAAFIGSPAMNLVEATIAGGTASFAGWELPLGERRPRREGTVILGIRPEAFEDA